MTATVEYLRYLPMQGRSSHGNATLTHRPKYAVRNSRGDVIVHWFCGDWSTKPILDADPERRQCPACFPAPAGGQQVYFAAKGDLIKIGCSIQPESRCLALGAELLTFTRGGFDTERILHLTFADHRVEGEWFTPTVELHALIQRVRELAAAVKSVAA